MIINSRLSILTNNNIVEITFQDDDSICYRITAKIPYNVFLEALGGRLVGQKCKVEVVSPDRLGKKREYKRFEFKIGNNSLYGDERKEMVKNCGQERVYSDGYN